MKKLNSILIILGLVIITGIVILQSCSKDKTAAEPEEQVFVLTQPNYFEDLFVFPTGTVLTLNKDGIHFVLPKGYQLISQVVDDTKGKEITFPIVTILSGTVNCKCTEGSGCNPYIIGDQSGCSTEGSCTECIMTIKDDEDPPMALLQAMVVDLNLATKFITDATEMKEIPSPSSLMFESKEVMDKLISFLDGYNDDINTDRLKDININSIPNDYTYVPVQFLGKLILAPVMKSKCISDNFMDFTLKETYTCTCNVVSSGCTLGSKWTPAGRIHYCDAGECTDCTLSKDDQEPPMTNL